MRQALLLIDVQKGFLSPYWGRRNSLSTEKNIACLLDVFRKKKKPIIHIQHLSLQIDSPLHPQQDGVEFMDNINPLIGERIFQKTVNSAFIGTNLESHLRQEQIHSLVLAGFTTDHCVSTSARMAANLGFKVSIISDATATFDRVGIDGTLYSAELVHQVSLASLQNEFATVFNIANFIL